jgi:hypothetical protein
MTAVMAEWRDTTVEAIVMKGGAATIGNPRKEMVRILSPPPKKNSRHSNRVASFFLVQAYQNKKI